MSRRGGGGAARRLITLALLLGALLGGGLLLASGAEAHATVVGSNPLDGARLKSSPSSVTISFDENVGLGTLGYLHVVNQQGKRVEEGVAFHPNGTGSKVSVRLPSGLPDGTYTESYRVVSADSHPVAGVVRFVIGNGALQAAVTGTTAAGNSGVSSIFDVARWISFTGWALLGGAWLLLTVWPAGRDDRRATKIVWAGWATAAIGAVLELLLEGPYAAGRPLTNLFNTNLIDATLHTHYGALHSGRLLLLGVLAALLAAALQPGRVRAKFEWAIWPVAAGIAWTFSSSGHPDTTNPSWLSIVADSLHLLAMAAWIGGLVMVVAALLPRREPDELASVLPVFSRVAFGAVVTMAVSGTYAAWRGIGSLGAIFTTEYGLLVDAKIVLFIGLVSLGNISRLTIAKRLRPKVVAYAMTDVLEKEDVPDVPIMTDNETERMRRSVWVEAVIAMVVLAVTSVLVSQPRGNEAVATRNRHPVSATANLGSGATAKVTINPGTHGPVEVAVTLTGVKPTSLTVTASEPGKQLGPIPVPLVANGAGQYTASEVDLPVSGKWVIQLVVQTSKFNAVTADVKLGLH